MFSYKTGKWPHADDRSVLKLGRYISPDLQPAPETLDLLAITDLNASSFPMYGNDQLGDCTCAGVAHLVQMWGALVKATAIPEPEAVVKMYFDITGGEDVGANEQNVLNFWEAHPLDGWAPEAFVACDPNDREHVKIATQLFGGTYVGLQLPLSVQKQVQNHETWDVVPGPEGQPGSWSGHCVIIVGYDEIGPTIVTWGMLQKMTWGFVAAYMDECWASLPSGWERKPGIDWQKLEQDLKLV